MRRAPLVGLLAALLVGAAVLLGLGLTQRSSLAYTPGVTPFAPVAELRPKQRACVAPITPPEDVTFDRVRVFAGTDGRPGPPLEVTVAPEANEPDLARGRSAGGYRSAGPAPAPATVEVGRVRPDGAIVVCVRNAGSRKLALFGAGGIASGPTTTVEGVPSPGDISVRLEDSRSRSLVALLPAMAERASRFKPGWAAPGVLGLLGALVLLGVPALLALALRRAGPDQDPTRSIQSQARPQS
jgi:hypothetical protein